MSREQAILEGALRARVKGEAAADLLSRAGEAFGENDPTPEAVDTWLGDLSHTAPHLFVPSVGIGSGGSARRPSGGESGDPFEDGAKLEELAYRDDS